MNRSNPQHFFWVVWVCKLLGTFLAHAVDYTRPKIVIRVGWPSGYSNSFFFWDNNRQSHIPNSNALLLAGREEEENRFCRSYSESRSNDVMVSNLCLSVVR